MSEEFTQDSAVAERLRLWLEGVRPGTGIHDALVAGPVDDERIALLPSSETSLVFVEESRLEAARALTGSTVVGYDGEFSTNGGEIGIGDGFVVQLEGYATAPYVAISCPTVFSIEEGPDREAVSADAETAYQSGVFPRFLLTQLVTVLDQQYWQGGSRTGSDPARLFVPAGKTELLSGPAGGPVRFSGGECSTDAPVAGDENAELLAKNPGIGRFLGAAKVLRAVQNRLPDSAQIAGFGSSLITGDPTSAMERSRTDSVFVVIADEQHYVTELGAGTLSKVPRDIAVTVEAVLAGAEPDQALQGRLGLKLSGTDHSPTAQLSRSKELRKLFSRLSITVTPAADGAAPPAVAVPVNPALIIVPVIVT